MAVSKAGRKLRYSGSLAPILIVAAGFWMSAILTDNETIMMRKQDPVL